MRLSFVDEVEGAAGRAQAIVGESLRGQRQRMALALDELRQDALDGLLRMGELDDAVGRPVLAAAAGDHESEPVDGICEISP